MDILNVEGAFAEEDKRTINWEGENYYRGCGESVLTRPDGSSSTCVKRLDHPGDIHEDFDGHRKAEKSGKMIIVVSFDQPGADAEGHGRVQNILASLKENFDDVYPVKVIAGVRDQADEVLMILEGSG